MSGAGAGVNWRRILYRQMCRVRGEPQFRILDELRASERWPRTRVREVQQGRLRELLLQAFEHVPYYRQPLLESGVVRAGRSPRVDLSRFSRLPTLRRDTIRRRGRDLVDARPADPGNPRFWVASAGTTGTPIRVLRDRVGWQHAVAAQLWFDEWAGCAFGEPKVVAWGPLPATFALHERLRYRLRAYLKHEIRLQHYVRSPRILDAYIERMNRVRPALVVGWASVAHEIACRAEAQSRPLFPPRAVMTSAEPLWPDVRARIERAFRAPVFDRYGSWEAPAAACECAAHSGLHVAEPMNVIEVVRPDGEVAAPGEVGLIVVTPLMSRAMPLIRYLTDDLGVMTDEPCPCGRSFARLGRIVGRLLDSFVRPDGTLVHGSYIRQFYRRLPWIDRFQVVQVAVDHVRVKLVDRDRPGNPLAARRAGLAYIETYLRQAMGEGCQVTFQFVEAIAAAPSGKYRATLRLIPDPGAALTDRALPATKHPAGLDEVTT